MNRAISAGHEVIGIRRGWGGLLLVDRDDPATIEKYILPLDNSVVRTIDRTGGTFLHTSRTNPKKMKNQLQLIKKQIKKKKKKSKGKILTLIKQWKN